MSDLHGLIMNIRAKTHERSYLHGHHDARHAAAELALEADARITALEAEVERLMEGWNEAVVGLQREIDLLHKVIRDFVYANDTAPGDYWPVTPEMWERSWDAAMDGLRAALEGAAQDGR